MLLGRLLLSAIFIQAGLWKLFNSAATIGYFESRGLPFASLTIWLVVAIELLGGLAILVGYRIRWASGLLAVFTLLAAVIGHTDWTNIMELQAFMKDVAIAGGLFYVAANGAGMLSFDARRN